jgi:diguanylate cyclase (GGDEF)-like protein
MKDRAEMLEATLDLIDGGVAILDDCSNVLFWNKAAATLTGYLAQDMISQRCPDGLYRVDDEHLARTGAGIAGFRHGGSVNTNCRAGVDPAGCTVRTRISHAGLDCEVENDDSLQCPTLVLMSHKLGHSVPGMLRRVCLRDSLGESTGTALLFYPVEDVGTLPHGEASESAEVERSQADMEDRLEASHHQWRAGRMPFGLLWIVVDQAAGLRKTHGRDACEAMLRTVEHTLLRQMKPGEIIGRWGNNEYLVLAHERTAELLLLHAQRLAGLARTADFRWWGDRVGLTVSIGASQAAEGESLQSLLNRARQAMQASAYAGGNHATESREG